LDATHVYIFVPLCLTNRRAVPASLFTLMPGTRLIPPWITDVKHTKRLLGMVVPTKTKKSTKVWDQMSVDVVQVWMEGLYKKVRSGKQVSDTVLDSIYLQPIHDALAVFGDKDIQQTVTEEVSKCMTKKQPRPMSPWCSSAVYALTHTVYVLGSYMHGICIDDSLQTVYVEAHQLLVALADVFGMMSDTQWALHAECAIEVTIALHLLSVDPYNMPNAMFVIPQSCDMVRRYVHDYTVGGTLSELASRRDQVTRGKGKGDMGGSIYGEIHTRMVVIHALTVFARWDAGVYTPGPETVSYIRHLNRRLPETDVDMVLSYIRSCPKDTKFTAQIVALALPCPAGMSIESRRSSVTHVLAYLCEKRYVLVREKRTSPFVPLAYTILT
jgi:hypothetical protein